MLSQHKRTRAVMEETQLEGSKAIPTGHRIYDALRRMAVEYDFKPNERINEVELAARHGVSRTPVREALQRLVTEGLITFQPNRGFFCRGFDAEEVVHLSDVRAALEEYAVRLATERASDTQLRALVDWWTMTSARADSLSGHDLTARDEEFHMRIAALSGNPELAKMLEGINTRIRFIREIEVERHRRLSTTYTEHTAIADAMARRDAGGAARLMRAHIGISASDAVSAVKEGLARIYMRPR